MHLGIIPDGNRRYCKARELPLARLLDHWIDNMIKPFVKFLLDNCTPSPECPDRFEIGGPLGTVRHVSLYMLSADNMKREDDSKDLGFHLIRKLYRMHPPDIDPRLDSSAEPLKQLLSRVCFTAVGDLTALPDDIRRIFEECAAKCTGRTFSVTVAVGYDGEKDALGGYGDRLQPPIDMVFRSGQELRLSGFFPRHTMYSELYFTEKLWPEVTLADLEDAVIEFGRRSRRFGK